MHTRKPAHTLARTLGVGVAVLDAVMLAVAVLGGVTDGVGVPDVPTEMLAEGEPVMDADVLGELDTLDDRETDAVADTAEMVHVSCRCGDVPAADRPLSTYR